MAPLPSPANAMAQAASGKVGAKAKAATPAISRAQAGSATFLAPRLSASRPPHLHGHHSRDGQRDEQHREPARIDTQPLAHGRQRAPDATDEKTVHREQACDRQQ